MPQLQSSPQTRDADPLNVTGWAIGRAKQLYDRLAKSDPEQAHALALRCIDEFSNSPLFYNLIFGPTVPLGFQKEAVEQAARLARAGKPVAARGLLSALRIARFTLQDNGLYTAVRDALSERESTIPEKHLVRAQIAAWDHQWSEAWREINTHLALHPDDAAAIFLRGSLAYRSGRWGQYAPEINALRHLTANTAAQDIHRKVSDFFALQGADLGTHGGSDHDVPALSTPGAVFERVAREAPPAVAGERSGIVMICGSLAPGGAERIVAMIYESLRRRHPEEKVSLWLFTDKGTDANGLFYLPLTGATRDELTILDTTPAISEPFSWLPPFLAMRSQQIYDELLKAKPRALHLTLDETNLTGGFAGLLAGVPRIVMHAHNMRPDDLHGSQEIAFGWERAYRALLAREEVRFVNVAKVAADDYVSWMGLTGSDRVRVIHNGFDFSQFEPIDPAARAQLRSELGVPANAPVVGTALRFNGVKQPRVWLDAAKLILDKRPDVHFVLFGDGELLADSQDHAAAIGLGGAIHFAGRVSDLHRRLGILDVFMLSSRSEGLPNVLIEAQAAGVVPVTFDVGGCAETLIDGQTGRLVRDRTAEALAAEVLSALADDAWRNRARTAASQFVRDEFSIDRMMGRLEAVLAG